MEDIKKYNEEIERAIKNVSDGNFVSHKEVIQMLNKDIKPEISLDTLHSLDIRFCKIESVTDILKNPKKDFEPETNPIKAYHLVIDTGFDKRDVVTNIVENFSKEDLLDKVTTFVLNLPPTTIRGLLSKGMIFLAGDKNLIIGGNIGDVVL